MEKIIKVLIITSLTILLGYSVIGTDSRVEYIRDQAPREMKERNWEIMRYEGYQYGSWGNHGGMVWYHVRNIDNHNIQYRVYVTKWNDELHWFYNNPETLQRIQAKFD